MTRVLPDAVLSALNAVLRTRPEIRRGYLVTGGQKPIVALELDERPGSVAEAQANVHVLIPLLVGPLGEHAGMVGFSVGGPEEIAAVVAGGVSFYERAAS